jgi:uncharacterized protein YneF (UPF0154 family)
MKAKIFYSTLILFLCFTTFGFARQYLRERKDKNRIQTNFEIAETSVRIYRLKNGQLASQNQVMKLHYDELASIYPRILDEVKNIEIRPKYLTQYSETVVNQEKEIRTNLRDSLILDTVQARVFDYNDQYYTVKGVAVGDSQRVIIHSRDSLIQVIYRGKRKHPWMWFFSKRLTEQVITCKNPANTILYNKTIQICKKR